MSTGHTDRASVDLLADIGATNARFALLPAGARVAEQEAVLPVAAFPDIRAAIEHYLGGRGVRPARAGIAIANPVAGDFVRMTNHDWHFSIEETRTRLGLDRLLVLNDFTALALSLPELSDDDKEQVGPGAPVVGETVALLGPGTGLGVSGLVPSGGGVGALSGEGGHVTMAAADDREADILRLLRQEFGHVSAERVLSGMGLENLYRAVRRLDGAVPEPFAAADISRRALDRSDPACVEALATFCAMLGTVAGNLALTLGARGGVYVGGGIVPRVTRYFKGSAFRQRFESKGRFREYLAAIPTYVIVARNPAFLGVAAALRRP
jgi:glucokinase